MMMVVVPMVVQRQNAASAPNKTRLNAVGDQVYQFFGNHSPLYEIDTTTSA